VRSLFTRVFIAFWIAILAFVVVATAITAVNFAADDNDPRIVTRDAANVLREEGLEGLETWLKARNAKHPGQRTLVIDASGRDILGQPLPRRARPRLPDGGPRPPHGPPGAIIHAEDGTAYAVRFDPPPRRGAFSPPFSGLARAVLLALAIAISGLVSFLLARSISRPLEDLQRTARTLADGQLEARTSPGVAARGDELGALAREFDTMAERLAALVAARQRLLRDLSHELRSPLARLRMAVDLARQPGADPARELGRIEREGGRLERLIAQILEYARLERDPATLERRSVDVIEILRQVVHDAEYESQSAPGRITLNAPAAAAELRADPRLLHAAFDNVLRNALLHGGSGAIEIDVRDDATAVMVLMRDHGPGVPAAEIGRIFEPFYRVHDEGAAAPKGSGIGLAVAAKAVQLLGGELVAENAPDGGLRMTFVLPRQA
jgi:two-component system, OmpR family, sensor kinase